MHYRLFLLEMISNLQLTKVPPVVTRKTTPEKKNACTYNTHSYFYQKMLLL